MFSRAHYIALSQSPSLSLSLGYTTMAETGKFLLLLLEFVLFGEFHSFPETFKVAELKYSLSFFNVHCCWALIRLDLEFGFHFLLRDFLGFSYGKLNGMDERLKFCSRWLGFFLNIFLID